MSQKYYSQPSAQHGKPDFYLTKNPTPHTIMMSKKVWDLKKKGLTYRKIQEIVPYNLRHLSRLIKIYQTFSLGGKK